MKKITFSNQSSVINDGRRFVLYNERDGQHDVRIGVPCRNLWSNGYTNSIVMNDGYDLKVENGVLHLKGEGRYYKHLYAFEAWDVGDLSVSDKKLEELKERYYIDDEDVYLKPSKIGKMFLFFPYEIPGKTYIKRGLYFYRRMVDVNMTVSNFTVDDRGAN